MEDACMHRMFIEGGEDRRLDQLFRTVALIVDALNNDLTSTDDKLLESVRQLHNTVRNLQLSCEKAVMCSKAAGDQAQFYENLELTIQSRMRTAEKQIELAKSELAEARQIRKHKQEYDLLAQMIEKYPSRKDLVQKRESVEGDIEKIEERRERLQQKLDDRRKQFYVLMVSLRDLQQMLQGDAADDE